jgi:flagellar hook-length control protein FliK
MEFIPQNISQLLGLISNTTQGVSKNNGVPITGEEDSADFKSILLFAANTSLESQTGADLGSLPFEKGIPAADSRNQLAMLQIPSLIRSIKPETVLPLGNGQFRVEVKERVSFNSQILKILLSNSKDRIELKVPEAAIWKLSNDLTVEKKVDDVYSGDFDVKILDSESPIPIQDLAPSQKAIDTVERVTPKAAVSFDLNSIFARPENTVEKPANLENVIPVEIKLSDGNIQQKSVKISSLFELLKEYPDPITIEISNIDESIVSSKANQVASRPDATCAKFAFDLKSLVKLDNNSAAQVDGVLTVEQGKAHPAQTIQNPDSEKPATPDLIVSQKHALITSNEPISAQFACSKPLLKQTQEFVKIEIPKMESGKLEPLPSKTADIGSMEIKSNKYEPISFNKHAITEKASFVSERIGEFSESVNKIENKNTLSAAKNSFIVNSIVKNKIEASKPAYYQPQPKFDEQAEVAAQLPSDELNLQSETSELKRKIVSKQVIIKQARLFDRVKLAVAPDQIGNKPVFNGPRIFDIADKRIVNIEDIKSAILQAGAKNINSLKIRLQPDHLGDVNIKLSWKGDTLFVILKTGSDEAGKILSSGISDLKGGLENASYKIQNISVIVDKDFSSQNQNQSDFRHDGDSRSNFKRNEENNSYSAGRDSREHNKEARQYNRPVRGWIDLKA